MYSSGSACKIFPFVAVKSQQGKVRETVQS